MCINFSYFETAESYFFKAFDILLPSFVFQVEFNKAAQSLSDAFIPSASRKAASSRLLKVLPLVPMHIGSSEVDFSFWSLVDFLEEYIHSRRLCSRSV